MSPNPGATMNHYVQLALATLLIFPVKAMNKVTELEDTKNNDCLTYEKYDPLLTTALRLILLNCIEHENYSTASYILSVIKLDHGGVLNSKLETQMCVNSELERVHDVGYQLYVEAHKENHLITKKILSDNYCLPRIRFLSEGTLYTTELTDIIMQEPEYKMQYECHSNQPLDRDFLWLEKGENATLEEKIKHCKEVNTVYLERIRRAKSTNQKAAPSTKD